MHAFIKAASFMFSLLFLCCSSQKKVQTGTGKISAEDHKQEDNPTLKTLSARLLDDNTFLLEGISEDSTYGYSPENAIKTSGGPINERRYLNALLGPNSEPVSYYRRRSCCPVKSENGIMGLAMLDEYVVTYPGLGKEIKLYVNMYDPGILKAPKGFTYKK